MKEKQIHNFLAMNTSFMTIGLPRKAQKDIEVLIRNFETRLSRFQLDSELSQLNQLGGQFVSVSNLLYEILEKAYLFFCETDGLFNPFLGQVVSDLGYDQSFEKLPLKLESSTPAKENDKQLWMNPLMLMPNKKEVYVHPNVQIDLGGIAKGWSAQCVAFQSIKKGIESGLIDAGGDIAVWGTNNGNPWGISIADPFMPDKDLLSFWIQHDARVGIATSNSLKRSWGLSNGNRAHHIVDPRTLHASESDLVQVTVFAPDVTTADVYAKVLLILGLDRGKDWIEKKRPDLAYVQVKQDSSYYIGGNINKYCIKWR